MSLDALNDILDSSIDDLKDLPEFKVPHTGVYGLAVYLEQKEINKQASIIARCTVRDVKALADASIPEAEWSKPGDKFDVAFIMKDEEGNRNEFAEGRFKEFMAPFHEHYGDKSIRNVYGQMSNPEAPVLITAKVEKKERKKKNDSDETKFDARLSEIVVD